METNLTSAANANSESSYSSSSSRYPMQFPALRFFQYPISTLLEYSGVLGSRPENLEAEQGLLFDSLIHSSSNSDAVSGSSSSSSINNGEVSIRITGSGGQEQSGACEHTSASDSASSSSSGGGVVASEELEGGERSSTASVVAGDAGDGGNNGSSNGDLPYHRRHDIQEAARWIEQILPYGLLLLVVFIRQHLKGFFVTIWITAFMFKSNEILRKQTALKRERKISVLVGYCVFFILHVIGVYWWCRDDDPFYPLVMVPPAATPPFWHGIFIILVNDTMVRQAAMALKLMLLMYYRNGRGHCYRRQGQMLTLVEYTLLLYRALLPTPVWYRFFLNKEYGSFFSSLITGLYLTFKLSSSIEKVQSFFAALKALSRKEIQYGIAATSEQVNAAGDLCAICQEKMHAPILLHCKHIFCEDCVSEWFERERTCPLCRALVRPADFRSFGDGSTTLFFQLF